MYQISALKNVTLDLFKKKISMNALWQRKMHFRDFMACQEKQNISEETLMKLMVKSIKKKLFPLKSLNIISPKKNIFIPVNSNRI